MSVLLEAGENEVPEEESEEHESDEHDEGKEEEGSLALRYLGRLVRALPVEPLLPENSILSARLTFAVHLGKRRYLNARDCSIQFRIASRG